MVYLWEKWDSGTIKNIILCLRLSPASIWFAGSENKMKLDIPFLVSHSPPPEHFYQPPLRTHASNEAIGMLVCTLSMTVWRHKNLTKQYQCSKSIGPFRTVQERKNKVEAERKMCSFLFLERKLQSIPLSLVSVLAQLECGLWVHGKSALWMHLGVC